MDVQVVLLDIGMFVSEALRFLSMHPRRSWNLESGIWN